MRIHLEKTVDISENNEHITIRLVCNTLEKITEGKKELIAPNGVKIKLVEANSSLKIPKLIESFVLTKFSDDADWIKGRAGMRYRDLIPNRLGGRFIASHINIPVGGIVPDYVHYHKIRFQIIYCYKGWAKLVYEDQGEPFVFKAGDCVLQPPQIRHRVLESSDNLEVIEIACPAEHETLADNKMSLPNNIFNPKRIFNGQKFIHYESSKEIWEKSYLDGFECKRTGIGEAANGLAGVRIIRPASENETNFYQHDAEFVFFFILNGKVSLIQENGSKEHINAGDALVIPTFMKFAFSDFSDDLEILEVTLPDKFNVKSGMRK